MEDKKKDLTIMSRHHEARSLLRRCFKQGLFSKVPFDVWKIVVFDADLESIEILAQTCWGFRELVLCVLKELYVEIALRFRKKGQITLALKCLQKCAYSGSPLAMFHLGYAYWDGGWGVRCDVEAAAHWFKRSAESGNGAGMALYAGCLKHGNGVVRNVDKSTFWARKALSSNNAFGIGHCYYNGLGTPQSDSKASASFQVSAKDDDEYGQFWLGESLYCGYGILRDHKKALIWYVKSAEKGLAQGQSATGHMLRHGYGCHANMEEAICWFQKAADQGIKSAQSVIKKMSCEV